MYHRNIYEHLHDKLCTKQAILSAVSKLFDRILNNLNIYNISLNRCKYANKNWIEEKGLLDENKFKLKKIKWNFIQNVILLSKNITVQLTRSINVRWIFNWNFSFKRYYNNLIFDSHLIKVNNKTALNTNIYSLD